MPGGRPARSGTAQKKRALSPEEMLARVRAINAALGGEENILTPDT